MAEIIIPPKLRDVENIDEKQDYEIAKKLI